MTERCRTCNEPYDGAGDGWDGECPDCADITEAARVINCESCGEKTTIGESPDGCSCSDCYNRIEFEPWLEGNK